MHRQQETPGGLGKELHLLRRDELLDQGADLEAGEKADISGFFLLK